MAVDGSKRHAGAGSKQPGGKGVHSSAPRVPANGRLRFTFYSNVAEAHDVQSRIMSAAEAHGFTGENFFALRIALEEALVNAMKHGNRMDARKKVHVEAVIKDNRVEIMVEDEGPGFERSSVPDPTADENLQKCSGRGILLIEAYMHNVSWDRGGRRLKMVRENK